MKYKISTISIVFLMMILAGCSTTNIPEPINPEESDMQINNTIIQTINETVENVAPVVVNGEEIIEEEIQWMLELFKQQNPQATRENAVEQLINQKILAQAARDANITVTDETAEQVIASQLAMQNATIEQYKQQLTIQGVSYNNQLNKIKEDLIMQAYLQNMYDTANITSTEEEIQLFYDSYINQTKGFTPPLEQIRPDIKDAIRQQKERQITQSIVLELRENSTIEYN